MNQDIHDKDDDESWRFCQIDLIHIQLPANYRADKIGYENKKTIEKTCSSNRHRIMFTRTPKNPIKLLCGTFTDIF